MSNKDTRNIDFQALYSKIPPDLQDAIYSGETSDAIETIAGKYNLNLFRMGDLSEEVGLVMLGVTHPRNFIGNLSRKLQVSVETAAKVAEDVDRMIFQKVAGSLTKIHKDPFVPDIATNFSKQNTKMETFIECDSCGAQVELPANFCDMCGQRLSKIPEATIMRPEDERANRNPSEEHLTRALALALSEDYAGAIPEARLALEHGLTPEDEILARAVLGNALIQLDAGSQDVEEGTSKRMLEGISELEKALLLDAQGGHGFFLDSISRAGWLTQLEVACTLRARWIHRKKGIDQAINYLQDKVKLFDYWPGTHMVMLNFEIGNLYREAGRYKAARAHWLRTAVAEPLSRESQHELQTKEMARNNLEVLEAELGTEHTEIEPEGHKRQATHKAESRRVASEGVSRFSEGAPKGGIQNVSDINFSFGRDFKFIKWKETLWLNFLRSVFAGPVVTTLMIASGELPPSQAFVYLLFPIMYFVAALPMGLFFSLLSSIGVPFIGLIVLLLSIIVAIGDPFVFLLHKVKPNLVPVEKFGFFNLKLIIFVLDEERRNREIA